MTEMHPQRMEHAEEAKEPELPDNWEELFGDEAPKETQPTPGGEPEPEATATESEQLAALQAENEQWRQWGTNFLQRQAQAQAQAPQGTPADPIEAALAKVKSEYDGVDDNTMKFFRDLFKEVLPAAQAPTTRAIQHLSQSQQQLNNAGVLEQFEQHLETLFDSKELPKSLRRQFKNDIFMEGHRRYGNTFDEQKANRLFAEAYSQYAEEAHLKNTNYVQSKTDKTNNSPPPTVRGNGQHAVEDIHKQIINSKEKDNDFGGANWRKMLRKKWAAKQG